MSELELVKWITRLQRQVDLLIKPEVPLGMSLMARTVLAASATSVSFSSIPQGFRHLQLLIQARTDAVAEVDNALLRINGDTGTNYDSERIAADGTAIAAATTRATATSLVCLTEAANSRADNFSGGFILIFGYSAARDKHVLSLSASYGDVSADTDLHLAVRGLRWRDTSVITDLALVPNTGANFVSGSHFALYGVM